MNIVKSETGFLFRILACSQSDNHPENNLAKSGYVLDMIIDKNRIFLYSLLPTGTYH